ncbi:MAG: glycosyltransferase family 4 protein, partial [Rickettsiales bacterium]
NRAKDAGLEEDLTFLDWVQNRKEFYTNIDIFCLPSLHEPFGIVILEAFTHGTPVIATNSEGPRDIITPNYDALIVEKGNATQLADAMETLINNQAMSDMFAANAFAKTKTKYSQEAVCRRIEVALNEILERMRS